MYKIFKYAGLSALAFVTAAYIAAGYVESYLESRINLPSTPYEINIVKGSSLISVINDLADKKVVNKPELLLLYARVTDKTSIKSGRYEIPMPLSHKQLLALFLEGRVKQYSVTLIEGWTIKQVIARLSSTENLEQTLNGKLPDDIQFEGGIAEGWLFPDTYSFDSSVTDKQLVLRAYKKMQQVLLEEWALRADDLPYKSPYEALIMASLIERETAVDSEREQIAGVFIQRLALKMRLQTDPTVIYAMGDNYNGNIRRKDLTMDSPYNTYKVSGLPPTPIAIAGRRSIHAALHPLHNGMLYFVGKGDGYHYFSKTLQEHNRAVQEFQRSRRKANYRSTPLAEEVN